MTEQFRQSSQPQTPSGTSQSQTPAGTGTATAPGGVAIIELWTFAVQPTVEDVDLVGFHVEATDGRIGKVDEATHEAGGSYLIVDTGPWIFGKKVMLPAGLAERIDPDSKTVFVEATKDEIKNAPEFDEHTSRKDKEYRERLGRHYGQDRR